MSKVDFDDYTSDYNARLSEQTAFFSPNEEYFAKYKADIAARLIAGHRPGRILEFGCGIGRNIRFLRAAFEGAQIIGSDISVGSLEVARRENPDIEFVPESNWQDREAFDLVFVAGVFHHVPPSERLAVAAMLAGRLRPGGKLVVFEHNPYNPVTRRIVSNCAYDADAVLLKPAEMRSIVNAGGFRSVASEYCLFVPPAFSRLARLERYFGWFPLGGQYWVMAERSA